MIPITKSIAAEGLWRIVCWQGDEQQHTQRVIKSWLVSRVPTPDGGVTFEVGAEWMAPAGVEPEDDTAALFPMVILPPGDLTTVEQVAEAHAAGRGDQLQYAVSPFRGAIFGDRDGLDRSRSSAVPADLHGCVRLPRVVADGSKYSER